jgi:polyphosphate glucokinase
MKVLVVDIGGTNVKVRIAGMAEPVKIPSGPTMTPDKMMSEIHSVTAKWKYDHVSIGYPGVVLRDKLQTEPHNLAPGWVGFDFEKAFGKPTRMLNDAAMQALGSYKGGRMLFLGLGTGLGSALVVEGVVQPLELAHLPYKGKYTYEGMVGIAGLKRDGKKKWTKQALKISILLQKAMNADYVVLGGGNVKVIKELPDNIMRGANDNAFLGGIAMWHKPGHGHTEPVH